MAGSTFQPPIIISAEQDDAQQAAFINQNFQSLATGLESNALRIVDRGTLSIPSSNIPSGGAGNYNSVNVNIASYTHNLGYIPAVLAYFEQSNGVRAPLPFISFDASSTSTASWYRLSANATTTTFLVALRGMTFGTSINTLAGNLRFYLLQEPAE